MPKEKLEKEKPQIPTEVVGIVELDEAKINGMNSVQIDNLKVEKEKEAISADRLYNIVEVAMNNIALEILRLRAKQKELEIVLDKAGHNKSVLKKQISILTSKFWNAKNPGA
jgi:DNA gyrase/topoisomerase IV subunit A